MKNQYKMNEAFRSEAEDLRIPQFCFITEPSLFHAENFAKLSKEKLSVGFSLSHSDGEME